MLLFQEYNSSTMMDTVWNAAHMNLDVTMGEFLKKTAAKKQLGMK